MKLEFNFTVNDLLTKHIELHNEIYESFNDNCYLRYEDCTLWDMMYEEYINYTREYSTGSCLFKEVFLRKLPNADEIMKYVTINEDSIYIEHNSGDKNVSVYVNIEINVELFKHIR